jgi:hypothetical protein
MTGTRRIFTDVGDVEATEESYGGPPKETEGRLQRWNQVFRGAQHDEEKSLPFWGLSIVEDGDADFGGNRSLRIGRFGGGFEDVGGGASK